jgi:hypothetical protein
MVNPKRRESKTCTANIGNLTKRIHWKSKAQPQEIPLECTAKADLSYAASKSRNPNVCSLQERLWNSPRVHLYGLKRIITASADLTNPRPRWSIHCPRHGEAVTINELQIEQEEKLRACQMVESTFKHYRRTNEERLTLEGGSRQWETIYTNLATLEVECGELE